MQIDTTAIGPTNGHPTKWMSEVRLFESERRAFDDVPIREDW
jgi:hypothetical protein